MKDKTVIQKFLSYVKSTISWFCGSPHTWGDIARPMKGQVRKGKQHGRLYMVYANVWIFFLLHLSSSHWYITKNWKWFIWWSLNLVDRNLGDFHFSQGSTYGRQANVFIYSFYKRNLFLLQWYLIYIKWILWNSFTVCWQINGKLLWELSWVTAVDEWEWMETRDWRDGTSFSHLISTLSVLIPFAHHF